MSTKTNSNTYPSASSVLGNILEKLPSRHVARHLKIRGRPLGLGCPLEGIKVGSSAVLSSIGSSSSSAFVSSSQLPALSLTSLQTTPSLFTTMRSFGIFAAVAAAACSIFASAAPLDAAAAGAGVAAVHARTPAAFDLALPEVEKRELKSIVAILTDVKAEITPMCNELLAVDVDVKVEVIVAVFAKIVVVLKDAYADCQLLIGADVDVILAAVDGTAIVAVAVVAGLLADILILILGCCAHVLIFVQVDVLGSVFVELGAILGSFTGCCCSLVGGLLELILPLIITIIASIRLCGFVSLAAVLNIAL
ncbi:hypothetical protein SCHPADRAFT_945472 [Schizopora paradoxa]|uniref:Uncharacterized protein n=1 Tax=Schizopora paradoxa TaxID=27342 RepID=A0A0H2R5U8_9AGAM|nr:hypothetical protein SCHPADRAFT_945472 [Schizopora paradoxa]